MTTAEMIGMLDRHVETLTTMEGEWQAAAGSFPSTLTRSNAGYGSARENTERVRGWVKEVARDLNLGAVTATPAESDPTDAGEIVAEAPEVIDQAETPDAEPEPEPVENGPTDNAVGDPNAAEEPEAEESPTEAIEAAPAEDAELVGTGV